MKITIFGAAFDPPHRGHFQIALSLLIEQIADQVWLLPVRYHEFGKQMSSDNDRLCMLELMVDGLKQQLENIDLGSGEKIRIDTHELDKSEPTHTYKTLCQLRDQYPEHQFSFVIGADNLDRFNEWEEYQALIREFQFYVYPRAGYSLEKILPGMKVLQGMEEVDVSSTQIRQAVKDGKSIKNLVSVEVGEYITIHQLYAKS